MPPDTSVVPAAAADGGPAINHPLFLRYSCLLSQKTVSRSAANLNTNTSLGVEGILSSPLKNTQINQQQNSL